MQDRASRCSVQCAAVENNMKNVVQEINLDIYWDGQSNGDREMRINEVQCLSGF